MKYDLSFSPPILNASGSLGFAPDPHGPIDLSALGAFVTNPISRQARSPARFPRYLPYPGGFLLHTGYPNPGLRIALREYANRWARSPLPVVISLLPEGPQDARAMVSRLEGLPNLLGVELSLPPEISAEQAVEIARQAAGELPLILRLPLDRAASLASELAQRLQALEAEHEGLLPSVAAISLGAPRGALALPQEDPEVLAVVQGRLFGPAIFPQTLAAAQAVVASGLAVIAGGGVYERRQIDALLACGVLGVQIDAAFWGLRFQAQA